MAGMWYYSDKREQKGPVSFEELRGLAHSGQIRPTDLVWREGTPDWVRASLVDRLFEASADPEAAQAWDEPGPRARRRDAIDGDRPRRRDDVDDDRPPRRQSARREEGMSSGLKIGLIVGGIALLLIVVAVVLIVVLAGGPGAADNYTVTLNPGQMNNRSFTCRAGQTVQITVTTNVLGGFHADVDCDVFEPGGMVIAGDRAPAKDCHVRFIARRTGPHRLVIRNLGPSRAQSHVSIRR